MSFYNFNVGEGTWNWTVPPDTTSLFITVYGGRNEDGDYWNNGGSASGTLAVSPGDTLHFTKSAGNSVYGADGAVYLNALPVCMGATGGYNQPMDEEAWDGGGYFPAGSPVTGRSYTYGTSGDCHCEITWTEDVGGGEPPPFSGWGIPI